MSPAQHNFRALDPAMYGQAAAVPDPESDAGPYLGSAKVERVKDGWAVVLVIPFTNMGKDGKNAAQTACSDYIAHRRSTQ